MERKSKLILLVAFAAILSISACKKKSSESEVVVVEYSDSKEYNQDLFYKDWVKSIELIPLESNNEIVLSDGLNIYECDEGESFIVHDGGPGFGEGGGIYRFDKKGRFLNRISLRGRGPGEYINGQSISISKDTIFLFDQYTSDIKIFSFLSDGTLLSEQYITPSSRYFTEGAIHDKGYLLKYIYSENSEDTFVELKDKEGNLIEKYLKSDYKLINSDIESSFTEDDKGDIFFRDKFRDTVFCINSKGEFNVATIFDLGEHSYLQEMYDADDFIKSWQIATEKRPAHLEFYLKSDNITIAKVYYYILDEKRSNPIAGVYNSKRDKWLWVAGGVTLPSVKAICKDDVFISIINPSQIDKIGKEEMSKIVNPEVLRDIDENDNPVLALISIK